MTSSLPLNKASSATTAVTKLSGTSQLLHHQKSSNDAGDPVGDERSTDVKSKAVLRPWEAYVHGAALVLLDGLGLGAGVSSASSSRLNKACVRMLAQQVIGRNSCNVFREISVK